MQGFIYLWYDRKQKRYYLGRHWGDINDGYICSSKMMRQAFNRRPHDFKRRILSYSNTKEDLVLEEQRWLDMIQYNELGSKYYNKTKKATTPSTFGYKHSEETKRKIGNANRGNKITHSQKWKDTMIGRVQSEEEKQKRSKSMLGKTWTVRNSSKMGQYWNGKSFSDEHKLNISNGHIGKNHSVETKEKIGAANSRNYINTVLVVDKIGNVLRINKDVFRKQQLGERESWDFVGVASKEARKRKLDNK
jgi:hypothetical protein